MKSNTWIVMESIIAVVVALVLQGMGYDETISSQGMFTVYLCSWGIWEIISERNLFLILLEALAFQVMEVFLYLTFGDTSLKRIVILFFMVILMCVLSYIHNRNNAKEEGMGQEQFMEEIVDRLQLMQEIRTITITNQDNIIYEYTGVFSVFFFCDRLEIDKIDLSDETITVYSEGLTILPNYKISIKQPDSE